VDRDPAHRDAAGAVLGRYKLLELIGEGGMGTVWMAEQTEPVKRKVAVKLIKPGMDSKQVLARFEAERQALALMDHPNIAKVHDAGVSTDGRPFFVMELVKGVPITRYCDDRHLTPRQRLDLFIPVCHAIQHAHQKGVIHRDIKPNNVLVTLYDDRPVPKVIDFGVAKATGQQLTEQTLHTGFGAVVGTVEYMSPEQAGFNQIDVDTRSDIYSLGVLLYELLTGSPPFTKKELEKAGVLEMLRVIREKEPSKPSMKLSTADGLPTLAANRGTEPAKLTKLVRGELDWIVMKALEKDRNRRYETANSFAMDIQRYLADESVLACPPSAAYRFRKFARRNKAALAIACVSTFTLLLALAGLAVNNWLVTREKKRTETALELSQSEKARADRNLGRARKVMEDYFADTAQDRRLKAAGLHDLRRALLMKMVAFLEEFARQEGEDRSIRLDRGWALFHLAGVRTEVGDVGRALADYDRAREVWAGLVAETPDNESNRSYLADCDHRRGALLLQMNRLDEADAAFRSALAARERLAADFAAVASHQSAIGDILHWLSMLARERKIRPEERRLLEQAIVHAKAAVALAPRDRAVRTSLAGHHVNLGVVLMESNKVTESAAAHREALAIFEGLLAEEPGDPTYRVGVSMCHTNLGNLYREGQPAEALRSYRQAVKLLDSLAAEFPGVPNYRRDLAGAYYNLGKALARAGQEKEADSALDKGLALRMQLAKEHPADLNSALEAANSLLQRALRDADTGRFEEALEPLNRLIPMLEPLVGSTQRGSEAGEMLRNASGARADVLLHLGRYADARTEYDRALKLDDGSNRTYFGVQRALALAYLKEHAKATAEVEAIIGDPKLPASDVQDAAAVYAVASAAVTNDAKLSERYAVRAIALLRRAFEKNYMAIAEDVRKDKNLAAVRSRDDFRKLVAEWEAKQKK
jgi:tetratricopeptide (TPR) repeat protein/tRNA A-37 threonylcarbamoyl transferase component Bud32